MSRSPLPYRHDWAVFLDVDGTLLDFADDPERVTLRPALGETLARIHDAAGGALALISGRRIDDLDRIFAPLRLPAAGLHGHERRDARGQVWRDAVDRTALDAVRREMQAFAGQHPGVLVEDKGMAVALHIRQAPAVEPEAARLADRLAATLPPDFRLQAGKLVFEVKPGGESKGTAIAALMADPVFAGRTPVFVGDDATDEDGFRWVNAHGGLAIKVGSGPSEARHRLPGIEAVAAWLEGYAAFLTGAA